MILVKTRLFCWNYKIFFSSKVLFYKRTIFCSWSLSQICWFWCSKFFVAVFDCNLILSSNLSQDNGWLLIRSPTQKRDVSINISRTYRFPIGKKCNNGEWKIRLQRLSLNCLHVDKSYRRRFESIISAAAEAVDVDSDAWMLISSPDSYSPSLLSSKAIGKCAKKGTDL